LRVTYRPTRWILRNVTVLKTTLRDIDDAARHSWQTQGGKT